MCFNHPMRYRVNPQLKTVTDYLIKTIFENDEKFLNKEILNEGITSLEYEKMCYDVLGGAFCLETLLLWNYDEMKMEHILSNPKHIKARNKRIIKKRNTYST